MPGWCGAQLMGTVVSAAVTGFIIISICLAVPCSMWLLGSLTRGIDLAPPALAAWSLDHWTTSKAPVTTITDEVSFRFTHLQPKPLPLPSRLLPPTHTQAVEVLVIFCFNWFSSRCNRKLTHAIVNDTVIPPPLTQVLLYSILQNYSPTGDWPWYNPLMLVSAINLYLCSVCVILSHV